MKRWSLPVLAVAIALSMAQVATVVNTRRLNLIHSGGASNCTLLSGSGAPEGAVVGKPCDVWLRSDSPAWYAKGAGTGTDNSGWANMSSAGTGDASTNTSTSVVSEIALFADTTGKLLKRATGSGFAKITSGVLSAVSSIVEGDFGFTDITTANASTSQHGLLKKLDNDNTHCISGQGNWVSCGGGTVTASSTDTFTNKTIDAEGTGNIITIPFTYTFVVAKCDGASGALGLSTPVSNPVTVACVNGTNVTFGLAQFADGGTALSMQGHFTLASDWTGAIDVKGKWRTSATSGDVVWQIATICVADAETSDPAFNTASTVTDTAKGTTLQQNDFSMTNIITTGCAAGEEFYFKILRDPTNGSDTLAATADLIALQFTIRRAL